jgi:hypothetical protein
MSVIKLRELKAKKGIKNSQVNICSSPIKMEFNHLVAP